MTKKYYIIDLMLNLANEYGILEDIDQFNKDNDSYTYDKNQNRISQTVNDIKTDYVIANTSNRVESSSNNSYEYDSAGNIIKANNKRYNYDNLNRLKTVTLDDTMLLTNEYNAFSQRVLKMSDGNKFTYIYNTSGQLLEERNKNTGMIRDYIYADGQLIAAVENGLVVYIVTDHTNTPQLVLDGTGRSIWNARYDAFGKTTVISNYKLNVRADGQYQDDETGLYYNWYRYYDPSLGRYITSDPIGLAGGMNTYIYVNGNPINATDPMGLAECTYSISGTTLTCKPNGGGQPTTISGDGIFSGNGQCRNKSTPECIKQSNPITDHYGPIVPGRYLMNYDDRPGHEMYWRLEPENKISGWRCYLDKRCGFELHPGSVSNGCITINKEDDNSMIKYVKIDELLNNELGKNILVVKP